MTAGPGLIGGLIVGVMTAKAICLAHGLPLVAVNHLEGHALSSLIVASAPFPYLLLLASGGHCQILEVQGVGSYRLLGGTLDDALGETFDKVAALIDLPYPGGPSVEHLACDGDPNAFIFPRPLCRTRGCDFSFSGLKTAVRLAVEKQSRPMSDRIRADICASFQAAAIDCLSDRLEQALKIGAGQSLVVAGGVAANRAVRAALESLAARHGRPFYAPPLGLCTDNGAMIAYAGERRLRLGLVDGLDVKPRPRWELESLNGRKGS